MKRRRSALNFLTGVIWSVIAALAAYLLVAFTHP